MFCCSDTALNYDIDACSLLPKAVLATKLQTMQGVFINTMTRNGVTRRVEAPKSDMTPAECKAHLLSLGDSCTPRIGSLDVSSPMLEDILSRVVYSYNPGALGWSYLAPDLSNGTCQCNLVSSAVHSGGRPSPCCQVTSPCNVKLFSINGAFNDVLGDAVFMLLPLIDVYWSVLWERPR